MEPIEGKRVRLRKIRKPDAKDIYENAKDKEIARHTTLPHPYRLKHAEEFIKKTQKGLRKKEYFELGIELKEEKKIIGMMSLLHVDYENKNAEVGYWVGKRYWRQGYGKEALDLILDFGFKRLKLARIYARVMHPNKASAKLLEKSGFEYEGRMRKTTLRKGRWMDDLRYAMLKEDYKRKKKR